MQACYGLKHAKYACILYYQDNINSLFCKKREKLKIMESKQINNEKQTINYEPIQNTPFTLVEKDKKFYIVLGDTSITTETFRSRYKANQYIKNMTWEKICNVICIIAKKICEYETTNNSNNSNNLPNNGN